VHAYCAVAGLARGAGGLRGPGPGPLDVAVGVVAQLECGGLCVRLGFEERAPGRRTLRECGGEEGGERVREQSFYFRGVQHRLWEGVGIMTKNSACGEERTWRVLSRMSTTTLCESGIYEECGGSLEYMGEGRTASRVPGSRQEKGRGRTAGVAYPCHWEGRSAWAASEIILYATAKCVGCGTSSNASRLYCSVQNHQRGY
jgi:hypothetical protein